MSNPTDEFLQPKLLKFQLIRLERCPNTQGITVAGLFQQFKVAQHKIGLWSKNYARIYSKQLISNSLLVIAWLDLCALVADVLKCLFKRIQMPGACIALQSISFLHLSSATCLVSCSSNPIGCVKGEKARWRITFLSLQQCPLVSGPGASTFSSSFYLLY